MRVFASALAISLAGPQAAWAVSPARVASLNLCTDELLLTLATPGQISSLSHLSRDPRESALWRKAQAHPANGGTILSVAKDRPDLIVTMGGGGRDSAGLAGAIGAHFLSLPFPSSFQDVERNVASLADALGRRRQGDIVVAQLRHMVATTPHRQRPAVFIDSASRTLPTNGAGRTWLAAAGYRQLALPGDRITREALLRAPSLTLVVSNYRLNQYSRSSFVPVTRARDTRLNTDGRRWTCLGPSMIPEIMRLRSVEGVSQ